MKNLHTEVGCSLWLVGIIAAGLLLEWLLLDLAFRVMPRSYWAPAMLTVSIMTMVAVWLIIYLRQVRRGL